MSDEKRPAPPTSRAKAWGSIAQGVGVLGVVIGVVLAIVVLVMRGRAADRLNEIANRIDDGLAKGVPLFAAARERIDGMSTLVKDFGAKVEAGEGAAGRAEEAGKVLRAKVTALSERYAGMRTSYVAARERAFAALDRLETIDEMIPAVDVPKGPVDALSSLDERVRALDTDLLALMASASDADSGPLAAAVTEKVSKVEATLSAAAAGIGDVGDRLARLRAAASVSASRIHRLVTIAAIVLAVAFLYAALLHVVLYRAGRRLRASVVVA